MAKYFCKFVLFLWVGLTAVHSLDARAGVSNGGGGLPEANQFIDVGHAVYSVIKMLSLADGEKINVGNYYTKLIYLENVVGANGKSRLVDFVDDQKTTVKCYGHDTLGCFRAEDGIIQVSLAGWRKASKINKGELVALEIFAMDGEPHRYPKVNQLLEYFSAHDTDLEKQTACMAAGVFAAKTDARHQFSAPARLDNIKVSGTVDYVQSLDLQEITMDFDLSIDGGSQNEGNDLAYTVKADRDCKIKSLKIKGFD